MAMSCIWCLLCVLPVECFRVQSFAGPTHWFWADGRRYHYFSRSEDFPTCAGHLKRTARWNSTGGGARATGGLPGLEGGIEYFVRPTLCEQLQGDVLRGRVGRSVSCSELEEALQKALDTWSLRHPVIYFRRVYDESQAELLIGAEEKHEGSGATDSDKTKGDAIAYAQIGLSTAVGPVFSTSGQQVPGFAIEHARVRFNPDHCFYVKISKMCLDDRPRLRSLVGYATMIFLVFYILFALILKLYSCMSRYPSDQQRHAGKLVFWMSLVFPLFLLALLPWVRMCGATLSCFNFETILRHEIGHVLGMDHPDIEGISNLDSDTQDGNHIPVNVMDPCSGIRQNPRRYWKSIMVSHGSRNTRMHKLNHDELGALNFLYPHERRSENRDKVSFDWMPLDKLRSWGVDRGLLNETVHDDVLVHAFKSKQAAKWLQALQHAEEEQHCEECLQDDLLVIEQEL